MASKIKPSLTVVILALLLLVGFGKSDSLDKDRAECADKLVGLAMCLPYVSGEAKAPTIDCCTGLKQVVENNIKCLCILIKDRDNPSLGIKINSTLALNLPNSCHVPSNISKCVDILHLDPNSSDAKPFQGLGNSNTTTPATSGGNSTSHGSSTANSEGKNDGGRGKRYHGIEMAFGALIIAFLAPQLVLYI